MKFLKRLVLVFLLLVIVGVGLVVFGLDPAARAAVEGGVGYATGCETDLGEAKISLLQGEADLSGLVVSNPEGFSQTPFLSIQSLRAEVAPSSLVGDVVRVRELVLDGLDLRLEQNGLESNVKEILARLASLGGEGGATSAPAPEGASPGPRIAIDRLSIRGVRATLAVSGVPGAEGTWSVEVPPIELSDLSTGGEETSRSLSEWAGTIVSLVVDRAAASGQGVFPAGFLEGLESQLAQLKEKAFVEARKVLADVGERGAAAVIQDAGQAIEEKKKELGGAVKGLFGKD